MKVCLGTGVAVAVYFSFCLWNFHVEASISNHHVVYNLDYPKNLIPVAAFFYVIATVTAPLLSGNKKIQLMGLLILIFYILSRMLFQPNLISVWCFFGTLTGLIVYWVIGERTEQKVIFAKNPV